MSLDSSEDRSAPRVRLAILDDHEVLLDSLSSWIGANAPDFDLVLSASTWLQLVHSDNFPTDLVFLDFQLKEPVSIEARVRTCRAGTAVLWRIGGSKASSTPARAWTGATKASSPATSNCGGARCQVSIGKTSGGLRRHAGRAMI